MANFIALIRLRRKWTEISRQMRQIKSMSNCRNSNVITVPFSDRLLGTKWGGIRLQICLRMLNLLRAGWVLDLVFTPTEWQDQTQSGQRFFNSYGMPVFSFAFY